MKEWYELTNEDEVASPVLLVNPDFVRTNITRAISMVGDIQRLRPHVKTNKSPDVSRLMMAHGIRKFKCATIAEAEMLAQIGADDVLIAYQLTGFNLIRYIDLIKKYPDTTFSSLIDHMDSLSMLLKFQSGHRLNLYLDLDVGMHRTGIAPGDQAIALIDSIKSTDTLQLKGFHMYDGHIRTLDPKKREAEVNNYFEPTFSWIQSIPGLTASEKNIIAGGSISFSIHAQKEGIECSPGTFVYWDHGYAQIPQTGDFKHAVVILSRVISKLNDHRICIDLGHKSVASENSLDKRVIILNTNLEYTLSGQSEEHLIIDFKNGHTFKVGEVMYLLPYHICPTVALHDEVIPVLNHHTCPPWPTLARKRKLTI